MRTEATVLSEYNDAVALTRHYRRAGFSATFQEWQEEKLQHELAEVRASERRRLVTLVLEPEAIQWQDRFHEQLCDDAIAQTLEHPHLIVFPCRDAKMRAVRPFTIYTPPITNEPRAAGFAHELSHLLDGLADPRQYAALDDSGPSLVSVEAEAQAWRGAIRRIQRRLVWTEAMHRELRRCICTYFPRALTTREQDAVRDLTAHSLAHVRPTPGTSDWAFARGAQIAREQKVSTFFPLRDRLEARVFAIQQEARR